MIDREEVKKRLRDLRRYIENKEWSDNREDRQAATDYWQAVTDAIALLKEQVPVKPEKEHSSSGVTWWNVCGVCKTAINPNDKYCHECGRAVKWE